MQNRLLFPFRELLSSEHQRPRRAQDLQDDLPGGRRRVHVKPPLHQAETSDCEGLAGQSPRALVLHGQGPLPSRKRGVSAVLRVR